MPRSLPSDQPIRSYVSDIWPDPLSAEPQRVRYLAVTWYPDVHQLRAAAARYERRRYTGAVDDFDDTIAIFQPTATRERYDRATRQWIDTTPAYAGTIRLTLDATTEVVLHEAIHAATHITRLHQRNLGADGTCDLGTDCEYEEERYAHLTGRLQASLLDLHHEILGRLDTARD